MEFKRIQEEIKDLEESKKFDDLTESGELFLNELKQVLQLLQTPVSGSLQIGYWFLDEYSNEVTVLHIFNEWCIVEDDFNEQPYILPLEFILTIKKESEDAERFLSNDR